MPLLLLDTCSVHQVVPSHWGYTQVPHFSLGKATATAANAAAAAAAVTLTAATHAADNAVSLTTDYAIATIAISASAAAPIAITIASVAATTTQHTAPASVAAPPHVTMLLRP